MVAAMNLTAGSYTEGEREHRGQGGGMQVSAAGSSSSGEQIFSLETGESQ